MDTQKSRWRQPGLIATIAVVFLINLVVDWFVFQPTNLALFIVIEALVLGGIASCRATAYASPRSKLFKHRHFANYLGRKGSFRVVGEIAC